MRNMSSEVLEIVANEEVIAVNQGNSFLAVISFVRAQVEHSVVQREAPMHLQP